MDLETQRKKRQEALEEKKRRLEELRKNRNNADLPTPAIAAPLPEPPKASNTDDVDTLVKSLLGPATVTVHATETSQVELTALQPTPPPALPVTVKRRAQLVLATSVASVHIASSINETYEKECQTDDMDEVDNQPLGTSDTKTPTKLDRRRPPPALRRSESSVTSSEGICETKGDVAISKLLSDEEKFDIISSRQFADFVEKSCRIMDRALSQSTSSLDLLRDYANNDSESSSTSKKFSHIFTRCTFEDESSRNRPVMDMQFSSAHPELFLACYGSRHAVTSSSRKGSIQSKFNEDDPLGVVNVWSTGCNTRPEYKFTASSPVLSGRFHEEEQRLIFGGCYTGQILLWDMRAKNLPVQRTSLSGKGHKHPVYSMHISSSELVTVSTDGILCQWDLTRLSEPTNVVQLQNLFSSSGIVNPATASSVPSSVIVNGVSFGADSGSGYKDFYVGAGSGSLYQGQLPIKPSDSFSQVSGHGGPITSMSINSSQHKHLKGLLLTSSVDWTVKLWNPMRSKSAMLEFSTSVYDYVSDVQWNPFNPALFSTICAGGSLALWHIGRSVVEPIEIINCNMSSTDDGNASSIRTGPAGIAALNKSTWSKDGSSILVGNAKGGIQLLGLNESLLKLNAAEENKIESIFNVTSGVDEASTISKSVAR